MSGINHDGNAANQPYGRDSECPEGPFGPPFCGPATSLRPLIGADTRPIAQRLAMGEIWLRLTIA